MEKQQAVEKIKELETKIAELKAIVDKPEKNVVTKWPTKDSSDIRINGKWAATLYPSEREGITKDYSKKTGREASMYLVSSYNLGRWYNEQGEEVKGYLYFEPAK